MNRSAPLICILAAAVTALFASPAVGEPFHHPFGEWREYNRDWLAVCPDEIKEDEADADYYYVSCFASAATGALNDGGQSLYKLTLILNRLDGELDVAFSDQANDGASFDRSRPLRIRFGSDEPMFFSYGVDLETRYTTVNQYFVSDPQKRDALVEAMKAKASATLTIPVAGGAPDATTEIRLSMQGVLASLDFMNAYARRVEDYN
ncbi:hypothetical protein [Devosia nitrariae]|uniref:Uncharacterized protein n=1 Tax=Devosia nitrariae TaxID=2071872 RepID=A0ABQ5W4K0_9HYPH|nr:hypothetical protein [Devosia nitrariae]GLQ54870.1 hypothetical protein GCM10010862_21290 [Devosia nitrariae]